jgi:uncharacterized membrane-anchored protein
VRRGLFVAAVALHALVLVGWAATLEWDLAHAGRIRLEVVQRDPRDLLRGDYVRLQYVIADIPLDVIVGGRPDYGDRIWVTLAPQETVHVLVSASRVAPVPAPGRRVIVGRVQSLSALSGRPSELQAHVVYGIERLYVPEGKGQFPRGRVEAEIALTESGRPFLTRVFVDGRPHP